MAFWAHTEAPVGRFVEKEAGNYFEYSINDDLSMPEYYKFPHIVWVGGLVNDQGYRYATVKKTVAYIVTDEDDYGNPIVEKWNIKNNVAYQQNRG